MARPTKRALKFMRFWRGGGAGEIRTHGGISPTAVFKAAVLSHSTTAPIPSSLRCTQGAFLDVLEESEGFEPSKDSRL